MSWADTCGNCNSHRADCDCGHWSIVRTLKIYGKVITPDGEGTILEISSDAQKLGVEFDGLHRRMYYDFKDVIIKE